mmetsp:Transcript_26035/g.85424  ORF Transcript_26035/g.85424 Transcript_26035/m.85424 type:complete len:208 (+) Transcript_26035:170-793(+)
MHARAISDRTGPTPSNTYSRRQRQQRASAPSKPCPSVLRVCPIRFGLLRGGRPCRVWVCPSGCLSAPQRSLPMPRGEQLSRRGPVLLDQVRRGEVRLPPVEREGLPLVCLGRVGRHREEEEDGRLEPGERLEGERLCVDLAEVALRDSSPPLARGRLVRLGEAAEVVAEERAHVLVREVARGAEELVQVVPAVVSPGELEVDEGDRR